MTNPEAAPATALPPALAALERTVGERAARGELPIPPYPAVALRVQEAMARRDFGLADVAHLVGADAALAADILRCANSAMYRRGAPVADLTQAITRIGAQQVMRLLLASGLAGPSQAVGPLVALRRAIWIEGLAGAAVCQELARLRGLRTEEAFVLGLLHDFGKIVVAAGLEGLLGAAPVGAWPLAIWRELAERQHVAVGIATAARWNLPPLVAEVIAAHHGAPGGCRDPRLLEAVRVADRVVALLLGRLCVTRTDLAEVPGLSPAEREPVERVLEELPEFVAAFETSASAAAVVSPHVAAPETSFAAAGRAARIGVSVSVARRPRLFRSAAILEEGLVMDGDEPLPENRLLEAKVYAEEPFSIWVLTRLSRPTREGFRVEVQPFALTGPLRAAWRKLVAGPGVA